MAAFRFSWRIVSQDPGQTAYDDAGNTVVGTYVYFATGMGNKGVKFIPDANYNKDHVKTVVRNHSKLIDEIGALSEEYN